MKTSFTIFLALMLLSCETIKVPAKVLDHFSRMEPEASDPVWTREAGVYQVDYYLDSRHTTTYYDTEGTWLETESEITVDELPNSILQTIQTKMGEYSIIDMELVNTKDGETLYEIDFSKDDRTYDMLFGTDGKILRKRIF